MAQDLHVVGGNALALFFLLLELAGVQMDAPRTGNLFHAALNVEAAGLEMLRHLALQASQAFPRVDSVGVEPTVRRDRDVQEVHVRRLFVHVDHGGDDILLPYETGKEVAALFKEATLFFWGQTGKERQIRCDNQAAENNRVFTHGFGQIERVDTGLHGAGVITHF